jgi:Mrp family chromosome partitioning ATPase
VWGLTRDNIEFDRLGVPPRINYCNQPHTPVHFLIMTAAVQDTPVSRRLSRIKHIIIICSGKGGVGKSSIAVQLALTLYTSSPDARVGILDIDLTGPSIPRMLGVDGSGVHQSSDGWVPVYADATDARLACMSVGFLLKSKGDSVVWRGPKKNAMIRQFLSDVRWGDLDYLVIDTPPGEHALLIGSTE